MDTKVLNYAATSNTAKNIVEADGFSIKGIGIIGQAEATDRKETKIISFASTTKNTKNIIEADGFRIKGVGMIGESVTPSIEKHHYVAKQRINNDMTEAQKNGVAVWNSMVSKLQEAGLMEDKK